MSRGRFVFGVALLGGIALGVLSVVVAAQKTGEADPQMTAVLDELATLGGKPIERLTPEEARKQPTPADAVKSLLRRRGVSTDPEKVGKVEDRTIEVSSGALPVRLYWPSGEGPFPVLVYFHGGGWVLADPSVYDASARGLTNRANIIVVSVDYRRAPEHPFPAAHEDALAAYRWALQKAASINGDPSNIAVGGESAGGNLAVAAAMMARDRQEQLPKHIMAIYPIAGTDTNTPSYRENAAAKPLNKPMMQWFFTHYFRSPADAKDPRVNLVAATLKGLPETTIVTAQMDPLRSEGAMLAEMMEKAGVRVNYRHYDGVAHEFFGMSAAVDKAKDAQQFAADALKRSFGTSQAGQ